MNIITVATYDWLDTQVAPFLEQAKSVMPDADYHLITVREPDTPIVTGIQGFSQVKHVTVADATAPGLLRFDYVRSNALRILGLKEGLYMDPDVDVLASLEHIPELDTDADIMCVRSPINIGGMRYVEVFRRLDLTPEPRPYNIGVMYLRCDYGAQFEAAMSDVQYGRGMELRSIFIPGTLIWNIIIARHANVYELPCEYDVRAWDAPNLLKAKVIHFSGPQMKQHRPYWDYSDFPNSIRITGSTTVTQ